MASDEMISIPPPGGTRSPVEARLFWQRFIDEVSFDVAAQEPPTHGGHNWVKIPMPGPVRWITAYGYLDRIGFYLSFDWAETPGIYDALLPEAEAISRDAGVEVSFNRDERWIGVHRNLADLGETSAQIEWLCTTANGLVRAFRPRLKALSR
jgi:hypothetical protein